MKVKNFVQDLLVIPGDLNQIPLDFYQDFSDFFRQIGSSSGSLQNGVIGSTSFLTTVVGANVLIQPGVCIASFDNAAPNNDFPNYCLGSNLDTAAFTLARTNGKLVANLVYQTIDGTRTVLSPANAPVSATVQIERFLGIQYSIITGTPTIYQIYLYDISGSTLTDRRNILFSGNDINGDGTTTSVAANTVSVKLDPGGSIIANGTSGIKYNPTQQSITSTTNINALDSSTTSVVLTGSTFINLNGIVAGTPGQTLTIYNQGSFIISVIPNSSSAATNNKILNPSGHILSIFPGYSFDFKYNSYLNYWISGTQLSASNIYTNFGRVPIYPSIGSTVSPQTGSLSPSPSIYTELCRLTLNKGSYNVHTSSVSLTQGAVKSGPSLSFSGNSATIPPDWIETVNYVVDTSAVTTSVLISQSNVWRVNITNDNTTVYMVIFNSTALNVTGSIWADLVG